MLPPPKTVEKILIWHNGALGDLLLAGPALQTLRHRYQGSGIIGVGHRERWELLEGTLPVKAVWDAQEGLWAWLYAATGALPPALLKRLSGLSLALVFSPKTHENFMKRLGQAGIREVLWVPSFSEDGQEPVRTLQARHLARLDLRYEPEPFYLAIETNRGDELQAGLPHDKLLLTVAPGSGQAKKTWPLSHYFEVIRTLAWEYGLHVAWLAGPAETAWLPYLRGMAESQGHSLLAGLPLRQVAHVLARTRLYIGGDSGITHLAAAARARHVLALFGPTDPRVWAPFGENITVLTVPGDCVPCTPGREITCPTPQCLMDLSPQKVLSLAASLLTDR